MKNGNRINFSTADSLQLIGSQMNFSLRSNQISVSGSPCSQRRPHSAVLLQKNYTLDKSNCTRPKSAEGRVFNKPLQWPNIPTIHKNDDKCSHITSQYTDSSSKLLQSLIGNAVNNGTEDNATEEEEFGRKVYSEIEVHKGTPSPNVTETGNKENVETCSSNSPNFTNDIHKNILEITNRESSQVYDRPEREESPVMGEKMVRFLEKKENHLERFHHHCGTEERSLYKMTRNRDVHLCCKCREHWPSYRNSLICKNYIEEIEPVFSNKKKFDRECESSKVSEFGDFNETSSSDSWKRREHWSSNRDLHVCEHEVGNAQSVVSKKERDESTPKKVTNTGEVDDLKKKNDCHLTKSVEVGDSDGADILHERWFSEANLRESVQESEKTDYRETENVISQAFGLDSCSSQNERSQESDSLTLCSESKEVRSEDVQNQVDEKSCCNGSTYEEIVKLLQALEEEDTEPFLTEKADYKKEMRLETPLMLEGFDGKIDRLEEVYSYLEEMEKGSEILDQTAANIPENGFTTCSKSFPSPRLEELLSKNSVELAHEVLSLKIQIEDQKKGIKLLRDTLAEMKEANQIADIAHQEALHKANAEAEALVQRHQKFIKQLLNEKKKLNETVSKLVEDLKSGEERYKRNIKAVEEKHLIEIKRVKEAQAVAEKLKREKWMEVKTQKIKEMTVKGLEPELSRMAAVQQQEMLELRNLHRAEIEAVELRAARRTSELMDQLRAELTKEKENAIERETEALRVKMEKNFEEERNRLEKYCQKLKDEIRRGEDRLSNAEMDFQQRIMECKRDGEKERHRMVQDFEEKLEENDRRHMTELRNLRETQEMEKEVWINNFKKQEAAKFMEREAELHRQYKKERDRDIEAIIETLERESAQSQKEIRDAAENKLKRLKEKMENDLKEVEASESLLKAKLSEMKTATLEKNDKIIELESQIRQSQTELLFLKKRCDDMSSERANLTEIIRKEFESKIREQTKEKENLEREISALQETHLKELAAKDQINLHNKNEMQKELTRVYSRIKIAVSKKEQIIESLRDENGGLIQKCQQLELMLDRQRRNLLLQ